MKATSSVQAQSSHGERRQDQAKTAQPIPDDASEMIKYTGLCYVATVSPAGRPNVSPKGTLIVLDEHTLAFADIASPNTVRNLRHCPYIEVNVVDPFRRRGYRFRGSAEVVDDPDLIALLSSGLGADYPVRLAVRITVEEWRPLESPIYWVTGAGEEEVRNKWEARLGYRRVTEQEGMTT